ncbi:hypothetical protein V7087_02990 [Neobacillus niacini]|uniref:nucleotidyltransferase domain-containing protein n=1 Tax=Neobacillus niacini TaxID=86668 RepID=UPI002FFE423D
MRTDIDNWKPLSVSSIVNVFSKMPITWCIAGGWALDLHVGRNSREHSDIDVLITRKELLIAYQWIQKDWTLYKAEDGKLLHWVDGEFLKSTRDVWVSRNHVAPWAFQIMIIDSKDGNWIYRREKSIKRAMNEIILKSPDGIPYLKPEIQLLYKAGSSKIREKDFQDLQTMLPILSTQEKEWLTLSLKKQFPDGHTWIEYL